MYGDTSGQVGFGEGVATGSAWCQHQKWILYDTTNGDYIAADSDY